MCVLQYTLPMYARAYCHLVNDITIRVAIYVIEQFSPLQPQISIYFRARKWTAFGNKEQKKIIRTKKKQQKTIEKSNQVMRSEIETKTKN